MSTMEIKLRRSQVEDKIPHGGWTVHALQAMQIPGDFFLDPWVMTRFDHDSDRPAITQISPTVPQVTRLHAVAAGNLH